MEQEIESTQAMLELGQRIGSLCHGGEVFELVGDIGAGKTTLTKGVATGMGIDDEVQSPTFTLSRTYTTPKGGILAHYDFYRLADPGILCAELADATQADDTTVVIEWADTVRHVLPDDRLRLIITAAPNEGRHIQFHAGGEKSRAFLEELR